MKSIKLSIINSVKINLPEPDLGGHVTHVNGKAVISNGTNIYVDSYEDELAVARDNGGKIIYATVSVENLLEEIIKLYLFEKPFGETEKTVFFLQKILQSNFFSFNSKKTIVGDLIEKKSLLKGEKKNDLPSVLRKIGSCRNAFAHNPIKYESDRGCVLQDQPLNDEYWEDLESNFNKAHCLLSEVLESLTNMIF